MTPEHIPKGRGRPSGNAQRRLVHQRQIMKNIRTIVCIVAMALGVTSCAFHQPELDHYTVSDPAVLGSVPGECAGPSDSKWRDFRRAASSHDFEEASQRWQAILDKYYKSDNLEDGLDGNMKLLAQAELMRALYVTGQTKKADKLLEELRKQR